MYIFPSSLRWTELILTADISETRASVSLGFSATRLPQMAPWLDIIEFAQAQTVDPIELNAPQLPPVPPTDRESSQGYQAMAASLNENLRHSATEVDIDAAPQGPARRRQGSSHHTPVMHRRSTVTPGGTTMTTPSVTRMDIPCNNGTTAAIEPSFPWIDGVSFSTPQA